MTQSTNHNTQDYWNRILIDKVSPGAKWDIGPLWWFNPINKESLRLTWTCVNWIKKHTDLTLHRVELQEKIFPKQMLQLERLFTQPYYFSDKYILVISEQDAVMLQLHGGDLNTYLDNLQQNQ